MNQFRYRPSVINILLPLVGMVTMVISPLLARRRAAPMMIPEEPQDELTEEEAEKIAERALVKTRKAEKYVKEARRAVKPSGGGGIGRFIIPTIFALGVRWLLMPPRRSGRTMMGAQTGGAQTRTGTPRMQQQATPMPPMPAEPERTLEPPERESMPGASQPRSTQFDYPSARRETRAVAGVSEQPQGEPDDLKVIEGIGPSIAKRLANHGIRTFAALADADVQHLQDILREEGILQLSDPHTWPEQARLAANGQWDELDRLKRELKAGR